MFGRSETKELRNWSSGRLDVAPRAYPRLNSIESFIRFHDGRGKPHVVYVNRLTQSFGLLNSGSKFKALTCTRHNAKLLRSRKVPHKSPGCHMVFSNE